jgi:hypothetical protein
MKPYTGKLPSLGALCTPRAAPAGAGFFSLLYESRLELYLFLSALARTALVCAAGSVTDKPETAAAVSRWPCRGPAPTGAETDHFTGCTFFSAKTG